MIEAAERSLLEVLEDVRAALAGGARVIEVRALDPDCGRGCYPGERVDGRVHRPYRVWLELAERLGLRMLTPQADGELVRLRFEQLDPHRRLRPAGIDVTERYGASSEFARISKHEEPGFVLDFADALARVSLAARARVLDLGVNTGDELALAMALAPALADASFVGVDHSASAIAVARARFGGRVSLHVADLAALEALDLGTFDLVISIGTLQSPGIDDREVVRRVVQRHLAPTGAVIFGFPNCRYIDGELEHGTRMKNFRQPELGLLVKDVAFYRKYLQQHHRRVFVTGQHYLFVTAIP
jgi:2-polyprenyl-3-methyl-5-hydroxy-6-metoxy-1,4-benzoquinol methylase